MSLAEKGIKARMTKPVTGQYEYLHRSGIGLDYFTSRIDRLTLYPGGRFVLMTQERSRAMNAAQSLMSGQQVSANAPETRREGSYQQQDRALTLTFDDGTQLQTQISWNDEGIQVGTNFFQKVSDSTMLPPTHRLKQDMDDIARGIKIASTIGGIALKAAKGIHDTIQTVQTPAPQSSQPPQPQHGLQQPGYGTPAVQPTMGTAMQGSAPGYAGYAVQPSQPVQQPAVQPAPQSLPHTETLYCDQCGAPVRPGKRFCNQCGARLP
jgi:hypothetical protein